MGLRVLALDRNPASPGFQEADQHGVVSTRDVPALCRFLDRCRARRMRIAGVTTMGSDIPDVVQAVAAHLGLPSISAEAARLATDKFAMKEAFRDAGVPIPWFAEVESAVELARIAAERGPDLVLKPVDRSGSRGVFLLDEKSNLSELFACAQEFSYSGRVQVEEYLTGPQISTETILFEGRALTPGFADRNYDLLDRFRPQIMENGGWVPSLCSAEERARVEDVVVRASLALGIETGVTKGDVVLTAEGPKVIEIAARLSGGDFCASLVPHGCGINYVRAAVRLALGEEPDFAELEPRFERAVANRYFFPEPGRLLSISGAAEVRAQDWLEKLEFWYAPGDEVPASLSHAHRFGVFVATAPDRETLAERIDWVYRTIRIETEPLVARAA
ncbi:MAG: ATP-grasp domain-containing protein [Deltaproteobacteria bacterium]|nr:ATP-grasp domain-containing protein [Deltaproteobacteria bacterium]